MNPRLAQSEPFRWDPSKVALHRTQSFADYATSHLANTATSSSLHHLVVRPFNLVFVFTNPWNRSSHAVISLTQEDEEGLWDYIYRLLNSKNNRGKQEGGCYLVYALLDYVVRLCSAADRRSTATWMC